MRLPLFLCLRIFAALQMSIICDLAQRWTQVLLLPPHEPDLCQVIASSLWTVPCVEGPENPCFPPIKSITTSRNDMDPSSVITDPEARIVTVPHLLSGTSLTAAPSPVPFQGVRITLAGEP